MKPVLIRIAQLRLPLLAAGVFFVRGIELRDKMRQEKHEKKCSQDAAFADDMVSSEVKIVEA